MELFNSILICGFYIDKYELDKNHWEEGFIGWDDAT